MLNTPTDHIPLKLNDHGSIVLSLVPKDWKVVRIGDITKEHKQGFYTEQKYAKNGIKLVRITDLLNPRLSYETMPYLNLDEKTINEFKIAEGDFLIARSGAIGRFGIVNEDIPCVFGSYIIRFVFDSDKLRNDFFGYLFQTPLIKKQLEVIQQGSSNTNINAENIKLMKIILPIIKEQQKIASILSKVDNLIKKSNDIIEQIQRLKKALLDKLFTRGIGHKNFKTFQYGTRWMTCESPIEWEQKRLDSVAKFRQGLQIEKTKRYKEHGKNRIKLIKVTDFYKDRESDEYIDIPPSSKSVICNRDDILVARTGNTLGMILTDVEGVFHNNTFALDYNPRLLDKIFFFYYLSTPRVQTYMKIISTRTGQPDLTHNEFSHLYVSIPPLKEQQKIAAIMNSVENSIRRHEEYKACLHSLKKGLIQKLLTGQIRVGR